MVEPGDGGLGSGGQGTAAPSADGGGEGPAILCSVRGSPDEEGCAVARASRWEGATGE